MTEDTLDDYTLLEAWRGGDAAAGEQLFRRHLPTVYRFFRNKTSRDIDDLVQEVMAALLKGQQAYERRGSFKAYLLGIARFRLYAHYQRMRGDGARLEYDTVTLYDLDPSPSVVAAEHSEERVLLEALRHLPVNLQVVLELTYWEDMPAPEIAIVVDVPTDTVYSRLRRAKELLKLQLKRLSLSREPLETTQSDLQRWAQAIRDKAVVPPTDAQIQTLSESVLKSEGN